LHVAWPPLVTFGSELAAELGHPVQINAYVTPPQNRGFAPHYDVHDVFVLQIALNTIRWRLILTYLTGTKSPYYRLFGIYYASTFFSQILPSVGGDVVRVLYRRTVNSTLGSMAISVVLDRGVAIAALHIR